MQHGSAVPRCNSRAGEPSARLVTMTPPRIWLDYFPRVLEQFGLTERDLTPHLPQALTTDRIKPGDRVELSASAETVLAEFRPDGVVTALVFDVLSADDQEIVRAASALGRAVPEWRVVVVTESGWRGELMHRGSISQYEQGLRDLIESVVHDANQAG